MVLNAKWGNFKLVLTHTMYVKISLYNLSGKCLSGKRLSGKVSVRETTCAGNVCKAIITSSLRTYEPHEHILISCLYSLNLHILHSTTGEAGSSKRYAADGNLYGSLEQELYNIYLVC